MPPHPQAPSVPTQPAADTPRTLFCCLATPDHYRRPLFSQREVFCGPDCPTVETGDGFTSLNTPAGEFDLPSVVARLPAHQRPDLIVVKADATRRNLPRGLDRLPGTKVLLVGDTHHFASPLRTLLTYGAVESFDAVVLDHTRQHAHAFLEAGFDRVYWIPAVDYALRRRDIPTASERPLTFVGQIGAFHPWRRHMMDRLVAAGLPLTAMRAAPETAADIYAASQVTLNVSLNGDLNLRVFEALGAGGFLLTDALSEEAGLERCFTPGRHLATYRSPGELVELARHYLDHPDQAMAIRRAGQAHLLEFHSPQVKRAQFLAAVFDDRVDPALEVRGERRGLGALPPQGTAFRRRLAAYEALQRLQLTSSRLTVHAAGQDGKDDGFAADLRLMARDLPRVAFSAPGAAPDDAADLDAARPVPLPLPPSPDRVRDDAVTLLPWPDKAETDRRMARLPGAFVLCPTLSARDQAAAAAHLAGWGFVPTEPGGILFQCADALRCAVRSLSDPELAAGLAPELRHARLAALEPMLRTAEQMVAVARLTARLRENALAERFLLGAVGLDRQQPDALAGLARLYAVGGRPLEASIYLGEARRAARLAGTADPAPDLDAAALAAATGGHPGLERYRSLFRQATAPSTGLPRRILVVTNLFPPQEFGGYGRKLWEFSAELIRRGHTVKVLTADVPDLARPGMAGTEDIEAHVDRRLTLYGTWKDGRAAVHDDPAHCAALIRANIRRVLETARDFRADACLVGNLDLLGTGFLDPLTRQMGVPVLHCLGNQHPGYALEAAPRSPLYRAGPASGWVAERLAAGGYGLPATVIYPGARVDHFHRAVMPSTDRLRIAFASLFVTYKGPQTLVNALGLLHREGVDFDCTFAGEAPDADLMARCRDFVERNGMAGKVRFTGFLDRRGLSELFARCNVLVFPSVFQEPFGISQVEAMAAGLTVVGSGTGGSGEVLRDGVDGLLFPAEDHQALAGCLRRLVKDRAAWSRMALSGRDRARDFTVARSVDRIEAVFEELDARKGKEAI
ncbi:Glycosyltransferase involved in cell wall bisynthesis [Azospirillum oryzae]|uniref:Glycosyltransferase involved in cell wall bisynthesis n=1 Tax=Azospirillum oryzae TaxID=286727 RepID=A0A1X7EYR8_9PROT|nr:glycosyltransferase [Azospirillum oryzae]SMF42638.1 Glycosyltransferase involved in cell wall bisynthesis [Azospirillum oryzae]